MILSEVSACVVDHGRFLHVARRLGRDFGQVYYYTPTERDCPLIREACIGVGFPEIERIQSIRRAKLKGCNLFVFPDIGFEDEQDELVEQGFLVWGGRGACRLESNRGKFLDVLKTTSLPVPVYQEIIGINDLRFNLVDQEDKYIKISKFRGDWETMHWTNFREMEGKIDEYAVRFGPLKESVTFYVFDAIDTEIEDGVDTYCIDGKWPETVLKGMECKDKAFLGTVQKFADVPKEVRIVNETFGPILKEYGYRGYFSTEVRITKDGQSYFLDPTCRAASPPSQVQAELFANLGEIVWKGAQGELVEPEATAQFGVQAALSIEGDRAEWNVVEFPDELDQWVKCGFCFMSDGRMCFPPITEYNTSELGYLCATGNSIHEAIENLSEHRDQLPFGVKCEFNSLADLLKEVHAAEDQGLEFTRQEVPEPETVVKK